MSSWSHGTRSGYSNHRCRCGPCYEVGNAYQRSLRKSRGVAASMRLPRPSLAGVASLSDSEFSAALQRCLWERIESLRP